MLVIVYMLAINKTVSLWKDNTQIENKLLTERVTSNKFVDIKSRSEEINSVVNQYFTDSISHDEYLLKTISEICAHEKVLLKEMPIIENSVEGNYKILTNRIVLEGAFHNLLRVVHTLENKEKIGRLTSINYKMYREHKQKRDILSLIIYVQCFINN